jgi:hypothetical protein
VFVVLAANATVFNTCSTSLFCPSAASLAFPYCDSEYLDLSSNFFTGTLPHSLEDLRLMEHLELSGNNFEGPIPSFLSKLTKLKELLLSQNSLTSQIPLELFQLTGLEQLQLHGNALTGGIPTGLGNLTNLCDLTLSYNEFKGKIPQELTSLQKLKLLHLHGNVLSGEAPDMMYIKQHSNKKGQFIADCGNPQETENPLHCPSCTICCNSDEECQVNTVRKFSLTVQTLLFFGALWGVMLFCTASTVVVKRCRSKPLPTSRSHPRHLLGEESVYSFVLANSPAAWLIFLGTAMTQVAIYLMFLQPADFASENSDWQYSIRCPESDTVCEDDSTVDQYGWMAFAVILFASLFPDVINGIRLMYKSVVLNSPRLWIGGLFHVSIAALASWVSYFYNRAIAPSNSELIFSAVILLFVNDIDECFLEMTMSVKPKWTKDLDDQINYTCEALDNFENPLGSWRTFNTSKHKLVDGGGSRVGGGGSQRNDVPLNNDGGDESLVSNLSYSFHKTNPPQDHQTNGGPGGPMGDSFNNDPHAQELAPMLLHREPPPYASQQGQPGSASVPPPHHYDMYGSPPPPGAGSGAYQPMSSGVPVGHAPATTMPVGDRFMSPSRSTARGPASRAPVSPMDPKLYEQLRQQSDTDTATAPNDDISLPSYRNGAVPPSGAASSISPTNRTSKSGGGGGGGGLVRDVSASTLFEAGQQSGGGGGGGLVRDVSASTLFEAGQQPAQRRPLHSPTIIRRTGDVGMWCDDVGSAGASVVSASSRLQQQQQQQEGASGQTIEGRPTGNYQDDNGGIGPHQAPAARTPQRSGGNPHLYSLS